MAALDRRQRVALLPLSDRAAEPLLAHVPASERLSTWRLVLPDGSEAAYGAGAVALARALGRPRLAAALAPLPLERLYTLVSRRRGGLGRLVPDGPAPRRYP